MWAFKNMFLFMFKKFYSLKETLGIFLSSPLFKMRNLAL